MSANKNSSSLFPLPESKCLTESPEKKRRRIGDSPLAGEKKTNRFKRNHSEVTGFIRQDKSTSLFSEQEEDPENVTEEQRAATMFYCETCIEIMRDHINWMNAVMRR